MWLEAAWLAVVGGRGSERRTLQASLGMYREALACLAGSQGGSQGWLSPSALEGSREFFSPFFSEIESYDQLAAVDRQ